MRTVSILLSIIVGVLSAVLFREHILETVSVLYSSFNTYCTNDLNPVTSDDKVQNRSPEEHTTTTTTTTTSTNMSVPRAIRKAFLAVEQAEGAGARVRRSIGTPQLKNFSPFLMLDHFSVAPGAGFPDHPHRGQEVSINSPHPLFSHPIPHPPFAGTPAKLMPSKQSLFLTNDQSQTITYMLSGAFDHEDFAGNKGTIQAGDLQFMTAGRGIVHSEMPAQNADGSANTGLQLWVDLPRRLKACEPRYRDLRASEIPAAEADGGKVRVKVISGESHGVRSLQDLAYTPVWLLDVTVGPGGKVAQPVPAGFNTFVYTLEGTALFGEEKRRVPQYHNVVFELEGDVIVAENEGAEDARFVIVAGQVLDQPVVQYGPFVVTSREEVMQAMFDYQTNSNGFERANGWASEIGKSMAH